MRKGSERRVNKTIEYRGFYIEIETHDVINGDTNEVISQRYTTTAKSKDHKDLYNWIKSYDKKTNSIEDIIEEIKFNIDMYLRNKDKFKIILTLNAPMERYRSFMSFLYSDIKNALAHYDMIKLESIKSVNSDNVPIYTEFSRYEEVEEE